MNFDLKTTEWHKISNLTDNSTYLIQAKIKIAKDEFKEVGVLFTQNPDVPDELDDGVLASDIKFKKKAGNNVYIRTLATPVNIQVEAV